MFRLARRQELGNLGPPARATINSIGCLSCITTVTFWKNIATEKPAVPRILPLSPCQSLRVLVIRPTCAADARRAGERNIDLSNPKSLRGVVCERLLSTKEGQVVRVLYRLYGTATILYSCIATRIYCPRALQNQ